MIQTQAAILLLCVACTGFDTAFAARVENLYSAEVPVAAGSSALSDAFDAALAQVLVKVTGRRDVVAGDDVAARFGDANRFVQQYRIKPDGQVWVAFDEVALRRELDRLGEPVWGAERPTTLVWVVLDEGAGQRRIVAGESGPDGQPAPGDPGPADDAAFVILEQLTATADARGLPLLLPLVDSQELISISLADVWGGYTESLVDASERYGPDAILVGRARPGAFGETDVRWTLLLDDERYDWEGDVAGGPNDVADFFAGRLATSVGSSTRVTLSVDAVDSLDAYGRLSRYLSELDLVEDLAVERVRDDRVVFTLQIRGDVDRLMRSIALQRVLQPVDEPLPAPLNDPFNTRPDAPQLHYRLMAAR